jgi:acid phosphatase
MGTGDSLRKRPSDSAARVSALRIRALAMAVIALAALLAASPIAAAPSREAGVPPLDHIIVVIMENRSYDQTRHATYTASLIASGSSFSASTAVAHPSLPNYLALWSGSTQRVTDDACPPTGAPYAAENLGHACEAAGLQWRAYSEDLHAPGSAACTAHGTLYTRKHDPWTDFSNLDHSHERAYPDLAAAIAGDSLPNLAFVIPNNCHNTHDGGPCDVAVGDQWLAANLPAMIAAAGPRGIVILTWDEDDFTVANHILTVFSGPPVKRGYVSARPITHYTVLRTICDGLGLPAFGAAKKEAPITDIWRR